MKVLIVGAGFAGSVIARELAEHGFIVTVIDKRSHIAGNCFDYVNERGIRVHKYGPHIFHTSNLKVVDWLSQFTNWIPYKHKVKAMLSDGRLVTLPVNIETSAIVGKHNVLDIFYRPYTKKMWGLELEEVDSTILSRVPIRSDMNELYFPDDAFQAIPADGYTNLFCKILDHKNIEVHLNRAYEPGEHSEYSHTFNSMSIDEFFDFKHGILQYRSIKFHTSTQCIPRLFPVATVNFTHSDPFTRVTEWKNFPNHGNPAGYTTFTVEEPCDFIDNNFERYYPVKDKAGLNQDIYSKYRADVPNNMTFIGRCGKYVYLDMHQAISNSLSIVKKFLDSNA